MKTTKRFIRIPRAVIGLCLVADPAEALPHEECNQQVDEGIREGIEQMLVDPSPGPGRNPNWRFVITVMTAVRNWLSPGLNKAILDYHAGYKLDASKGPAAYSDQPPSPLLAVIYLKPGTRNLLSPAAAAAIEDISWRWGNGRSRHLQSGNRRKQPPRRGSDGRRRTQGGGPEISRYLLGKASPRKTIRAPK